jgi:hypothetical protein
MVSVKDHIVDKEGGDNVHWGSEGIKRRNNRKPSGVGGMERIIMPRQVSLFIAVALRLSTAAFRVRSSLMWSWICAPSE